MKASATQVSACKNNSAISVTYPLPLERVGNRVGDGLVARRLPDQALDDGAGGVLGDAADTAHRRLLGAGDGGLGRGQLGVEFVFQRLAAGLRSGRLLVTGLVGDRLRIGAGIGQRFLIGRDRRVRLCLQSAGFRDIVVDVLLPAFDDAADAR